jgi:CRP-like cAMP-binding protein
MKTIGVSSKPDPSIFEGITLFEGLSRAELEKAAALARQRRAPAGSFFFQEGDPAEYIYALVEGRVRLVQVTMEGQQVIHFLVTPVGAFGVISVLAEADYPVSAQAIEDSLAFIWDRASMNDLMLRIPRISLNAIRILSERIEEYQDRLRELATERVERRLARALLRLVRQAGRKVPEGVLIDLPLSRQDLAEMTGTTLFTVSRTLSQWEAQGIVQSGRERVVIIFPHGLVRIAEDLPDPRDIKEAHSRSS